MKKITLVIFCLYFFFFGVLLIKNFSEKSGQQFVILAEGFLRGKTNLIRFDPTYGDLDVTPYKDMYFWAEPPFSAIVLMPFVFVFQKLSWVFYQGYLQFFITAGITILAYKLSRKFLNTKINSLFLAFTFVFSSIYIFIAVSTEAWYFSQSIAVLLLLASLYEWYTKRRLLLVGVYMSLVLATRFTAVIAVLFFILEILFSAEIAKEKISRISRLLMPLVVVGFLLLGYNYQRFDNIFVTGYENNNIKPEHQAVMLQQYGLFKLVNVPTNIYWYFFAPPDPILEDQTYHLIPPFFQANPWGMSFFIMSPMFFLIFKTLRRKMTTEEIFLWIASIACLIILLLWYSTGYFQVGPRYLLDILPLWFILLLIYLKKTTIRPIHYLVVAISSFLNLFWVSPYR